MSFPILPLCLFSDSREPVIHRSVKGWSVMSHRGTHLIAPLIPGLLLAFGAGFASPVQASCGKDVFELLNVALVNAPTNFVAIRGPNSAGNQYRLTPAPEQFCPTTFVLKDIAAGKDHREYWKPNLNRISGQSGGLLRREE
jgi:hypothetical protein